MQSLQPDPAAHYRNMMDGLWRIITTEGSWRLIRGLNVTAVGAGPAHALYFACYEKLKKTLSDRIHPGANSHLANGTTQTDTHAHAHTCTHTHTHTHTHIHTHSHFQTIPNCFSAANGLFGQWAERLSDQSLTDSLSTLPSRLIWSLFSCWFRPIHI